MEDNTKQLALVNELSGVVITKDLVASDDFSKKYEYLLALIKYLDEVKSSVDDGLKTIAKDNYFTTGEPSIVSTGFRYTYIPETTRETFDSKALKADNPSIYKEYVKVSHVKETFRVIKLEKKETGPGVADVK